MRRLIPIIAASALALAPSAVLGQDAGADGCAAVAQAAAQAVNAQIATEDRTIAAPQSVTGLTCLDDFFNGIGLDIFSNFNMANLVQTLTGQLCAAVRNAWQNAIGSAECGLSVNGFNLGFGAGGGTVCPALSIGGGGPNLLSTGVGYGAGAGNFATVPGHVQLPLGYGQ